jgi:hypothetical protein
MWHLSPAGSLASFPSIQSTLAKRKSVGFLIFSLQLHISLDRLQSCNSQNFPFRKLTFLPWRRRQEVTLKRLYVPTKLHDVETRKLISSFYLRFTLCYLRLQSPAKHVYTLLLFFYEGDRKINEAVKIRVISGTPCGGLRRATGVHKMKKTKVLPFCVVKISFLLFLAYVGTVYM